MFSITSVVNTLIPSVQAASWLPTQGSQNESVNILIRNILNTAIIIVGVLATFYLVWAGIRYIMSGGDASKAKEAQQGIQSVIIGTVVALVAFVVVQFIYAALDAPFVTDINQVANQDTTTGGAVVIIPSDTPTPTPTYEVSPTTGPLVP